MSTARDRIKPVTPSNQPAPTARRDPDEGAAAQAPTSAATPLAAGLPVPAPAAALAGPRDLGTFLGPKEHADGQDGEPSIPLSVLTRRPRLDPDDDLDQLNADVPRYVKRALRSQAFLEDVSQRSLVLEGLLHRLDPTLLQRFRKEEEDRNR